MPGPPPATVKPFPCLSFGAAELLEHFADGRAVVEFGSGGSTLWLAKFAWIVESFETDPAWYQRMSELAKSECGAWSNVRMHYVDPDQPESVDVPPFDVAFVDSFQPTRRPFLLAALRNAQKGSVVVADDPHFPSVARTIETLDRNKYEVEELIGRKPHDRHGVVSSHTAFIRVL